MGNATVPTTDKLESARRSIWESQKGAAMSLRRFWRTSGVLAVLVTVAISVVAAQSALTTSSKTDAASSDELLSEVRGLRADVQQAARISLRAQLLVGRLQLQEQRINVITGRLVEVRRLIGVTQSGQIPLAGELRRFEEALRNGNIPADERKDVEDQIPSLKAQFAQMQREEQQLRLQETDLAAEVATEQGRWLDFNSRLDELERLLPATQR